MNRTDNARMHIVGMYCALFGMVFLLVDGQRHTFQGGVVEIIVFYMIGLTGFRLFARKTL